IQIAVGFILLLGAPAVAAPPQLRQVTPPALQAGAAGTLIIDGTDLLPNPQIVLPVPVDAQTIKQPSTATRVQIEVKLAPNIPAGIYQLRLANDKGISNPMSVEIDDGPQQPFAAQV